MTDPIRLHEAGYRGERIASAALRVAGEVWTLPPPVRHCHLVHAWSQSHWRDGGPTPIPEHEQGFVTSTGRFVDRVEARRIAKEAGQLLPRASVGEDLFSEDVW